MFSDQRFRKPFIIALTVSVVVLLLVFGTNFARANREALPPTKDVTVDSPDGWGDDGTLEVGVEWINDFPGTADDRSHWDESCDGLYNDLVNRGWTSRFHWTDWNAYETDFKKESAGGEEDTYVDTVDIAMVCTHGSGAYDGFWGQNLSSVYFGSSHNDQDLSPGDAYLSYGEKDLEWLAFDSCSVLSDGGPAPYFNRGYWATSMNGLHQLLGFKNTMYVYAPGDGDYWTYYMNGVDFLFWWLLPPSTVLQSWFTAVDYNQPSVTCARVIGEESDSYNDYLWGKGYVSPDYPDDGDYWYWDHCSRDLKESVDQQQPEILAMPIYDVSQRLIDENYVMYNIAPAFNMTSWIPVPGPLFYFMWDPAGDITRYLQVDRITGSFIYHDLSKLWVPPTTTPDLPTADEAYLFTEDWFKNQGEALPGVWYRDFNNWTYAIEQMVEVQTGTTADGEFTEKEVAAMPTDGVLTYPRMIPSKVQTQAGTEQLAIPVFGPGARIKMYFGDAHELIGMQGGMRDIIDTGLMVETMTAAEAWQKFLQNRSLAIPEVDLLGDTIVYTAATLGYYEQPYLLYQRRLIPVWNFMVNSYENGTLVAEGVEIFVPAAWDIMPPEVAILSPYDGATFSAGEQIFFDGSVVGGTPPYLIGWNSSTDGYLGGTEDIIASIGSQVKNGNVLYPTVTLTVIDSNGFSSSATISLKINPIFWLPFIGK